MVLIILIMLSIEAFAGEGVKVMLTELDMNMLPNPEGFGGAEISQKFELQKKYNPYVKGVISIKIVGVKVSSVVLLSADNGWPIPENHA